MSVVRTLVVLCALLLFCAASAAAQQTIFIVRHAERADGGAAGPGRRSAQREGGAAAMVTPATDPPLSDAGKERAGRLAGILGSTDIKHIFTTEFMRTRQTAALAKGMLPPRVEITQVPSRDTDALITRVTQAPGNVLVVGHSNTVPEILKRLGIKEPITIADTEYDNLFIVVRPAAGDPTLIRLRY
jgi:broad specificity phosphatase PhoE